MQQLQRSAQRVNGVNGNITLIQTARQLSIIPSLAGGTLYDYESFRLRRQIIFRIVWEVTMRNKFRKRNI